MTDRLRLVRRAAVLGIAIILITNAVALVGAAYNRSGEPESILQLTERELTLPYTWDRNRDDSGLALRLNWRVLPPDSSGDDGVIARGGAFAMISYYPSQTPTWLDSAKLSEIGFDLTSPVDTARGGEYYRRALPKRVLVVLELDGPTADSARERARAWVTREEAMARASGDDPEDIARRLERVHTQLRTELLEGSRLFAVDAGTDRRALRARYADRSRFALIRSTVDLRVTGPDSAPRLEGYLGTATVEEINVPRAFRPVFEPLRRRRPGDSGPAEPYSVTVAFGRRLEPWIVAAERRR